QLDQLLRIAERSLVVTPGEKRGPHVLHKIERIILGAQAFVQPAAHGQTQTLTVAFGQLAGGNFRTGDGFFEQFCQFVIGGFHYPRYSGVGSVVGLLARQRSLVAVESSHGTALYSSEQIELVQFQSRNFLILLTMEFFPERNNSTGSYPVDNRFR